MPNMNASYPNLNPMARHPFDVHLQTAYTRGLRLGRLMLRARQLHQGRMPQFKGSPKPLVSVHNQPLIRLPSPAAVRPVVTS